MNKQPLTQSQLQAQLRDLGVKEGGLLVVHCAFSQVRPVVGGPLGLIEALTDVLGDTGTLVMPSMTDYDDPPFDPQQTPCMDMGIVAHTFWQLPDVQRSDSPHAFAARGPLAESITAPHPVDLPHGLDSPVGRVYEQSGQILLLGVGHDANTTIHLAESLGGVRYRRPTFALVRDGQRIVRVEFGEIDHCCQNFNLVDGWLDEHHLQRHGRVGYAAARLMLATDVVQVVTTQIAVNETVFLHPYGVDEECDEARASIGALN